MTIGLHEETQTAFDRAGRTTDANIIADVQAAVDYLRSQPFVDPDKIGITGFCFGGRVAFLAASAVSGLSASAVFYGGGMLQARGGPGPTPLERAKDISVPVLGLFGEEDGNPKPEDVATIEAELKKLGKAYEFHTYPGCGHAFHRDASASYRRDAAADAWGKALGWFNKHLKGEEG